MWHFLSRKKRQAKPIRRIFSFCKPTFEALENRRLLSAGALDTTFNPSGNIYSTGNALLDTLIGNYNTYVESDVDKTNRNRFSQFEGYVADTWKARRNLTLDIGARYYLMTPPHLVDNTASTFLPDRFDPRQAQTVIVFAGRQQRDDARFGLLL